MLPHEKAFPWYYYIAKAITRALLFILIRWEVRGRENIPRSGPLVVVANHLSMADPPLVHLCLGRRSVFMAKEELFRPPLFGYLIGRAGAFPVQRSKLDRAALRNAESALARGWALVIFPEGTRSLDGVLKRPLPGAALIAHHAGAPLVPVAIAGTEQFKRLTWIWRRPRITFNIGGAFTLPGSDGHLTRERLEEYSNLIMTRLAGLLPEGYRGEYREGQHENR